MNAIRVDHLSKRFRYFQRQSGFWGHLKTFFFRRYESREVLHDICFEIPQGQIVGVIGPNGAGKSTLIKILTGILSKSEGSVDILGLDPFRQRIRNARQIGAVFGQRTQLYWDLPLIDSYRLAKNIYQMSDRDFQKNLDDLIAFFDLGPLLEMPVRKLSLGQRLRGDLAMALLHDSKIIYLDEPTIGLDILGKDKLRKYLLDINQKRGTTILITTHDLFDLEKLCSRLILMNKGQLLADESMETFLTTHPLDKILTVDFADEAPSLAIHQADVIRIENNRAWIRIEPEGNTAEVVSQLIRKYSILDLAIEIPQIEDIIRNFYETMA